MGEHPWATATIECSGSGEALYLFRAEGHEALGWPYEMEVDFGVVAENVELTEDDFVALIAGHVIVRFGEKPEDAFCGVFRSLELLASVEATQAVYRGIVVPKLWVASQTYRCRVYQEKSVKDIVDAVLKETGLTDVEWRLTGTPAAREFVLQHEETDLAFISRLLEHEGIYTHFTHDPEAATETLVLCDQSSSATDLGAFDLDWRAGRTDAETVLAFSRRRRSLPKHMDLREYNYRTAAANLLVTGNDVDTDGRGFQHLWGEHYKDLGAGKALVKVRTEELLATRTIHRGRSTIRSLRAGVTLSITTDLFGLEGDYFVTEVRHRVVQSPDASAPNTGYENDFVAIRKDVPYRPPRVTPLPRIAGLLPATIDGEAPGTPAPIDDLGRYKVVLPFDTVPATVGRATRWIRMCQPHTGAGYGIHFPLHIGAEVMLGFVHGDPDRPVIVGAVPASNTPSPVVKANATQSVVRTRASIHIELEDDAT